MIGKDAINWFSMLSRSFTPGDWFKEDGRPRGGDMEDRLMWVYREKASGGDSRSVYEVGFYDPRGEWHAESTHADREEAAARVNYLNGGTR